MSANVEHADSSAEASVLATLGESNDWRTVDEMPIDPYSDIIKTLKTKDMGSPECTQDEENTIVFNVEEWRYFISTLGKLSKYFEVTLPEPERTKDAKKNKKKSHESAAEIIERKERERRMEMIDSINSCFEDELLIKPNVARKYTNVMVCIFLMIRWALHMYKHIDEHYSTTPVNLILDCICSISRMRSELSHFPDYILTGIDNVIEQLKHRFTRRICSVDASQRMPRVMKALFSNERLFIESTWEKVKPNSRQLYSEQKEVYNYLRTALEQNAPLFATYKVSPGSGKTFLAAVLAAMIEFGHNKNNKDETFSHALHSYERAPEEGIILPRNYIPMGNQKIMLYSCYNVQVRNMVSGLCRDADIAFWVASSYIGETDGIKRTTLRPFKTLYQDFRAYRKARDDPMRHGSLDEQWIFNIEHTIRDPAIIIADPESCSVLLDAYPERFVGYFDEVTAGAEEGVTSEFARHTCNLLKKAPRQTILLSATLQNMEQLSWCRDPFIARHTTPLPAYRERVFERSLLTGERWKNTYNKSISKIRRMDYMNFMVLQNTPIIADVKSSRLNISCSVFAPFSQGEGETVYRAYMPHMRLENITQLGDFITRLENDSALIRMYSPEAVYYMITPNESLIPDPLKFSIYFEEFGLVKHVSVRNYILDLFRNIHTSNNIPLFEALKAYNCPLLSHKEVQSGITIDQSHILTSNAYLYDSGKVIQVSTSGRMPEYVCEISEELLDGSPSIESILADYREQEEKLAEALSKVQTVRKVVERSSGGSNGAEKEDTRRAGSFKADSRAADDRKADIERDLAPKLRYSRRYLVNSHQHSERFVPENAGVSVNDSTNMMLSKDTIQKCFEHEIDDRIIKLYMSGVAIRDVARMGNFVRNLYERSTKVAKFFISDSSIVYGTNIKSVNSISVTTDYAASPISTRNSIYQLMGRAGRSGQSDSAKIIFHSMDGIDKLFGDENYEAIVMEQIAAQLA